MRSRTRVLSMAVLLMGGAIVLGPTVTACGSSNDSSGGDNAGDGGGSSGDSSLNFIDDAAPSDASYSASDLWANDPPPAWCGPDGGAAAPAPPGGTPDCPDDKNREGCPCTTTGETAACWPGLRANRGLGVCKDGTTTCVAHGEFDKVWGPCTGYVLPNKTATKGKEACKCFSAGKWDLTNVVPCYLNSNGTYFATSAAGSACSANASMTAPAVPWSKDTLTVDCAGHFKLCFTIKVGDAKNPQPSDCVITSVCTEGDYTDVNKPQAFPDLPGWSNTTASACVEKMFNPSTTSYGEMTVQGKSVRCDDISDTNGQPLVFKRVPYCASDCAANSTRADCVSCQASGTGGF